jgi:hypothetical protein
VKARVDDAVVEVGRVDEEEGRGEIETEEVMMGKDRGRGRF